MLFDEIIIPEYKFADAQTAINVISVRKAMYKANWKLDGFLRLAIMFSFCAGSGAFLFWVWMEWYYKVMAVLLAILITALACYSVNRELANLGPRVCAKCA